MITVGLSAHTPANVRWAVSPALEALGWLRLTRDDDTDPTYGAPSPTARQLLDDPDVSLVCQLLPSGSEPTPDFLAPAPPVSSAASAAAAQFAAVGGVDPVQAAAEIHEAATGREPGDDVASALRDGSLPARAAHGLQLFWERGMQEVFEVAEATLRAEIDRCTRTAEHAGIGVALSAVHERISWDDNAPDLWPSSPAPGSAETPLLVIPTALYGARLAIRLQGEHPFVAYPVGAAPAPNDRTSGLRRLLGPTRAVILRHLSTARTTTELSEELRLATATVSYHVKVMQRAGLLVRSRRRHNVFYELSPTGRQLLSSIP